MTRDIDQFFQQYLLEGEKLLWTGKPESKCPFVAIDIFLIPISILLGGIAAFGGLYGIIALINSIAQLISNPSLILPYIIFFIFCALFFAGGIQLIIGKQADQPTGLLIPYLSSTVSFITTSLHRDKYCC